MSRRPYRALKPHSRPMTFRYIRDDLRTALRMYSAGRHRPMERTINDVLEAGLRAVGAFPAEATHATE